MDLNFNPQPLPRAEYMTALAPALFALSFATLASLRPAPAPTAHQLDSATVEREIVVMGTRLRGVVLAISASSGFSALEAAFSEVRRVDRLVSSWREDSDLSRVNRSRPDVPVEVPGELLELLATARAWTDRTFGAFDPAVGALIDAWDLRGTGRRPSCADLAQALAVSGRDAFRVDEKAGTVTRLLPGAWMTAGGFGKGAALRAAVEALVDSGVKAGLLDFGGQLVAVGSKPAGSGWLVGVAHPGRREREVARLKLQDRAVATSGESERFVEVEGVRYGHILDPRTGIPVPAWGSVTVVAKDPLVADVLSTALFVMGPDRGSAWAEGLDEIGVLFLSEEGGGLEARWNAAMGPWLVELDAEFSRSVAKRPRSIDRFEGPDAEARPVSTGSCAGSKPGAAEVIGGER